MDTTRTAIQRVARDVIRAAGAAGSIDEVRRIAVQGWPETRDIDDGGRGLDQAKLRAAVRAEAKRVIAVAGDITTHLPVKHPDTIPDLAPDCRQVLRDCYRIIQSRVSQVQNASADRRETQTVSDDGSRVIYGQETITQARRRISEDHSVGAAIAEYRRVAALWGVDVG